MTRLAGAVLTAAVAGAAVAGLAWRPWAVGMATEPPAGDSPADDPARPRFAEDRGKPAAGGGDVRGIPFDGGRAVKYLNQLCDLGPRVSGSDGMAKQQEIVTKHFEAHGAAVTRQEFEAKQNSRRDKVRMTNLVAAWHPERTKRVILCTHYDTRPMAHEEPDRRNWNRPFVSANDGTSGVAFLMELAHHLKDLPTAYGVDLVLFDGEEYIFEPTGPFGGGDRFFFGSDHFADQYVKNKAKLPYRYEAAVLFDLFAHPGATFPIEGHSWAMAPTVADQLWKVAAAVGAKGFQYKLGGDVSDDHLALNRAGIPAVDVIDFEGYRAHWHRLSDTPDKVSGDQMAEVAKVVTTWLQAIRPGK
jgi:hypothetical protein